MTRTIGGSATPVTVRNIQTTDGMRIVDANGTAILLQNGLLPVITAEHYQIHAGAHYFASDIDEDVDILTPKNWLVIAPPSGSAHAMATIRSSKNGKLEIFEDATVSDNGSSIEAFNNDRRTGASSATLQVFADPTVTGDGTRILAQVVGDDASSGKGSGGLADEESELIINESTIYLIRYTSNTDNNRVSIVVDWYEVGA